MKVISLILATILLSGCQIMNKNYQKDNMINKKFKNNIEEKNDINNWVSSDYTDEQIKSKNFNHRKPNMIIVHHTDSNEDDFTIKIFKERNVSSHYLVSRTGKIIQFVDEKNRAFHAGASYWNGFEDINSSSIGIELSNDMKTQYTDEQINSLVLLIKDIMKRYGIRKDMVVGHLDVSPVRKIDPYINFPWERLAKEDLVVWCDGEYKNVRLPKGFNWEYALTEIGYNPNILEKALVSFRIKYFKIEPIDKIEVPTLKEKKYMYCLLEKTRLVRK